MFKAVLKRVFYKGFICFELPRDPMTREVLLYELKKCHDKHNDFVEVTLQSPRKPRTTGKDSQNHHLNGHIMQIARETGNDFEVIKYCVKMRAVEQLGYPFKELMGHIVPQSEALASTAECALLIEAAHLLAADMGIILQEG